MLAALLASTSAFAQGSAEALVQRVQERLAELGFYDGPVNGDFGERTQAALAQFQLSVPLPAGGQLDDPTLAQLGVRRESQEAAAGASAEPGTAVAPNRE